MTEAGSRGAKVFAAFLVVLGCATIATNLVGLAQFGSNVLVRAVLAIVYGGAAVLTGIGLWRQSHLARVAYLAWCMTIPLFMMTFPESLDPYLIPSYIGTIAVLAWGYSFVSRHTLSK